jgi:8-oxo-dGTP pyrophosphatase MutT (NUDIX family)
MMLRMPTPYPPRAGSTPPRGDRPLVPAAVLVPLYRDAAGDLRLVLVVRGSGGIHGDQVGLPGGKREPGDASLLETALREAEEEIGLARRRVRVLGALAPLDTRVSGFRVHPFVARIEPPARWRPAAGEITGVVVPRVGALCDPGARSVEPLLLPGWTATRHVDCIRLEDGHLLWGLTLRLLDPLLPRLAAGEFPA